VAVVVHNEADRPRSDAIAARLRARGIPCVVSDAANAYGKQIRAAERFGIPYVWFPASGEKPDEVRDIRSGAQAPAELDAWLPDPATVAFSV
jgi:histidyl-tRNA synthetase